MKMPLKEPQDQVLCKSTEFILIFILNAGNHWEITESYETQANIKWFLVEINKPLRRSALTCTYKDLIQELGMREDSHTCSMFCPLNQQY